MRTKALLCAAGFLAAAAATSMAQSNVYSLNVVGYINVPYTNGFQMVANQLHSDSTGTNNTVAGVFSTNFPNLTRVYGYAPGPGYGTATYSAGTGNWVGGQPTVNNALSAGGGVWLQIPGTTPTSGNLTEVGEVHQGTTLLPVVTGFQIMSLVPPLQTTIKTAMGYPAANLDRVYQYVNPSGFITHTYAAGSGTWTAGEPTPKVGESFWVQRAGAATTWTQTYNVP
jgi:hypothetical protein